MNSKNKNTLKGILCEQYTRYTSNLNELELLTNSNQLLQRRIEMLSHEQMKKLKGGSRSTE